MFGISLNTIAFMLSMGFATAALLYVILFDRIERERNASRRIKEVKLAATDSLTVKATRDKAAEMQKRRRNVQESLKDLDDRQKDRDKNLKNPPLKRQIAQAGLKLDVKTFYLVSMVSGVLVAGVFFILQAPLLFIPAAFFAASFGLPRWFIGFMRKRRIAKFLNEFPNAIDVIVRAIKSGLPLNDGLRLIANEAAEPVRSEFRRVVEAQQLGVSTPESLSGNKAFIYRAF